LNPLLANDGIDIYGYFVKGYAYELSYGGKQIALPTECFSHALWYNAAILEKCGVPIPEPDYSYTMEEFEDALIKTTRPEDGTWGISMFLPSWHIAQPFYNAFGARVVSEDGKKKASCKVTVK
jgi:ABC-type glycerol-3-phosphate transport system substrate-binding protein